MLAYLHERGQDVRIHIYVLIRTVAFTLARFVLHGSHLSHKTHSERTVNLMDIYPTLTELCNLPAKKGLEGNSIAPLLQNPGANRHYPSVPTHGFGNHAVHSEKWRYVRYNDGSEKLYDHDSDPQEFKNLAKDSKYAAVKGKLAKSLPTVNTRDGPTVKEGKE